MDACESCERASVEILEACDDPGHPYRLCSPCHARLLKRSLRPLEWFNLAKRHGWWLHLLHEDFYSQDGIADQPLEEVSSPSDFPAPTLEASCSDLESLFQFSVTRWDIRPDLLDAWRRFAEPQVLSFLYSRFTDPLEERFRYRAISLAVALAGGRASHFVREAWRLHREAFGISALASLSSESMSVEDALSLVLPELESLGPDRTREHLHCLFPLASPPLLEWIETHAASPVVNTWGELAARCEPDVDRLHVWIQRGRPLSLVALDTLLVQILATERGNATYPWKSKVHALLDDLVELRSADPAPRVKDTIDAILSRVI